MVPRAQLTQERSRLRRDELLGAAIDLFAEGGSRAVTHRAVAARAGLPSATTTYYFESIDELIREAIGAHVAQWTRDLDALTAVDLDADLSLDEISAYISAVFAQRGPEVAAVELSIFLAAARAPELQDLAARAQESLEGLITKMMTAIGIAEPGHLSAAIVALIAGIAMRRQISTYTEQDEALLLTAGIRDLVAAHVLGPGEVDRALTELRRARR